MQRTFPRYTLTVAATAIALAGCTQQEEEPAPSPPPSTPLLYPENVREMTGAGALDLTPGEIQSTVAGIVEASDTFARNDIIVVDESGEIRRETKCLGVGCLSYDRYGNNTLVHSPFGFNFDEVRFEPVAVHNGVAIGLEESITDPIVDTFAGWLEFSYFGTQWGYPDTPGSRTAYSMGKGAIGPPRGNAHWTGAMTGVDLTKETGRNDPLVGKADIEFELRAMTVDVTFSEIVNLSSGRNVDDLEWQDVEVFENGFSAGHGTDRIIGRFYGSQHAEVGGAFERDNIYGAFGANKVSE